jgi:hypothetical protein
MVPILIDDCDALPMQVCRSMTCRSWPTRRDSFGVTSGLSPFGVTAAPQIALPVNVWPGRPSRTERAIAVSPVATTSRICGRTPLSRSGSHPPFQPPPSPMTHRRQRDAQHHPDSTGLSDSATVSARAAEFLDLVEHALDYSRLKTGSKKYRLLGNVHWVPTSPRWDIDADKGPPRCRLGRP